MNKVYACIDNGANTNAVIDWAAWSALRLGLPLEFLHVLERREPERKNKDYSGAIGVDAQESLLQELSEQDEERSKLAREAGRNLLAAGRERAAAAGVTMLDVRLRSGVFVDNVLDMESDAQLFVLGEHHHATTQKKIHVDHKVERVIRAANRQVLVVTGESFEVPLRFVLPFDGSAKARATVEKVIRSPLLTGLPVLLAMVGIESTLARRQLEEARQSLQAGGFVAESEIAAGEPQAVLPAIAKAQGPALMVMGPYAHSRLHQFVLGSTTTTLLRTSDAPVLVLR